jgi:hypothetical protein
MQARQFFDEEASQQFSGKFYISKCQLRGVIIVLVSAEKGFTGRFYDSTRQPFWKDFFAPFSLAQKTF